MSFSTQNSSWISSICSIIFVRSYEHNTSCTSSSQWYVTVIITRGIKFFSNYFQLLLSFFTINDLINFFKGLKKSLLIFLLFVQFWNLKLSYKYLLYVFWHLHTYLSICLPPWPSNTPNIEFPPPISNYDIVASYIDLRQPSFNKNYLASNTWQTLT